MENNLPKIKEGAKRLCLLVPLVAHETYPFLIQHPFTESSYSYDPKYGMVNIVEDKKAQEEWLERLFHRIDSTQKVWDIYFLVCKAWRLTFYKFVREYLNEKTSAEMLASAWVFSENPNMDANCSLEELVAWFKESDKKHLMVKEDYAIWDALPDEFSVYRGVGVNRIPMGLSWTRNIETARRFANRWGREGFIQKATVQKKDALAYFNTRDEDEVVVDIFSIKDVEKVE